ncbi:hypothetical protein [Pseudomonas amygdali]|uniref:hypothetical protein n=1 Tax=Pseudomonas amygdali TaxID=47877 RepID=UPI000EFFDCAB|nr:hypothetical protein [Pseudomonas amygdali]
MTKSSLANKLTSLAESSQDRSIAARLREVFPEIEQAIGKGVSRSVILQTLQDDGMEISMKTFESALYRMRKAKLAVHNASALNQENSQSSDNNLKNPVEHQTEKEAPRKLNPLTPADFKKIREDINNMDLDALIRGKGIVPSKPKNT